MELLSEGRVIRRRSSGKKACVICIFIITIAIGIPIAIAIIVTLLRATPDPAKYGIVIDAGSTGSKMYIYQWDGTKTDGWNSTPIVNEIGQCFTERSLSSFENEPARAGPSLESCLGQAKEKISSKLFHRTYVYVIASGAMRLLREKNLMATNSILTSVRLTLKSYPFVFRIDHVRIMSELDEGIFKWKTANYLNVKHDYIKQLRGNDSGPVGTVDMGETALQISFLSESSAPSNNTPTVHMFGMNYSVYSHSFHCYGNKEAYRRALFHLYTSNPAQPTVAHPCAPRGTPVSPTHDWLFDSICTVPNRNFSSKSENITFLGSGDPTKCTALIMTLFDKAGDFQPHLRGTFLALSAFFDIYEFFRPTGTPSWTTLQQLTESVHAFCSKSWDEVLATPVSAERKPRLSQLCFDGAYVIEVLKVLGFDSMTWTNIMATDTMSGTPVGWSLGFLLTEINSMSALVLAADSNQAEYTYHYGYR